MRYLYFIQETIPEPGYAVEGTRTEEIVVAFVQWLRLGVEAIGAVIIALGVIIALYYFIQALIPPQEESYNKIRLVLARYLALALEFQLAADILSTAVAPTWDQIGKLGAIAVIRTLLNFFLTKEIAEEKRATGTPDNRSLAPDTSEETRA